MILASRTYPTIGPGDESENPVTVIGLAPPLLVISYSFVAGHRQDPDQ